LAEFETVAADFMTAGYGLAAIAVDDPNRSEPVRQRLGLSFPILCDPSRGLLAAWGILNEAERGGVAVPSVFVIDANRQVTHRWFDSTTTRVTAASVLATLRGGGAEPERRMQLGLGSMVMAIGNAIRRGGTTPRS
jgi:peroxiredoxin